MKYKIKNESLFFFSLLFRGYFIFLSFLFIFSIFIRAKYLMNDSPVFELQKFSYNILIFIFIISFLFFKFFENFLKEMYYVLLVFKFFIMLISILFQILFIIFVPLEPFSDMLQCHLGAIEVTKNNLSFLVNSQYFNLNPNNIFFTLLLGLWYKLINFGFFAGKLLNIFCNILITVLTYEIFKKFYKKESLLIFALLSFFPPMILYCNHIYNDVIFTFVTILAAYLYFNFDKKTNQYFLIGTLLGISHLIRPVGFLFLIAFIITELLFIRELKNILFLAIGFILPIILFYFLFFIFTGKNLLKTGYPIWSYIYIGLNSEKFGFQDGSHSLNRNFNDIIYRIFYENGILETLKIIFKKIFWMWTEGTYQSERYGFWNLGLIHSSIRNLVKFLSYTLYFSLILLSCIHFSYKSFFNRINNLDKSKPILLIYIVILNFLFLLFYAIWEIKSRYIYALYPYLIITSFGGMEFLYFIMREKLSFIKKRSLLNAKSKFLLWRGFLL